jgi:hypothetical protein
MVFSADGTPFSSLSLACFGLSNAASEVSFDITSSTLLLADANSTASKLVALDAVSRVVRWSTGLGGSCYGMAVLPAQGLVVASALDEKKLRVHRLTNGALVTTAPATRPAIHRC